MRHKDPKLMEAIKQYITDYYLSHAGMTPSTTQIAEQVGIARSTAYNYLVAMDQNHMLEYRNGEIQADFIRKLMVEPTIADAVGRINCGSPALEEESLLFRTALPTAIFGQGPFYILYASGDSMEDAGICDGDTLVIRRGIKPRVGDIVVALDENSENTLKRYAGIDPERNQAVLEYMNEKRYPGKKIYVNELICQGVLSHIIKTV